MSKRRWTKEQLSEAVKTSTSFRQVLSKLNLRQAGSNYVQLKKYISENSLKTKHFKGRAWNKGLTGFHYYRIPLEKVLIKNRYSQSYKLKKRLFVAGIKKEKCEICGWAQKTKDGRIPLELDHVNGKRIDNRIENLRILCPNCHSLTDSYRGRNIKHRK